MSKPTTLKDVSVLAGVSTATVARVLYKNGYVARETQQRVMAALQQSGYRTNVLARGLRTQQSQTIGHLLQGISPNPFFAGVAMGVEQEALQQGYSVLIFNAHSDAEHERLGVETFIGRRVDAIIFTTAIDAANVQLALASGIPTVQVERVTPARTSTVLIDNYQGAFAAMEHLIMLGHRRIAFIGGDPDRYPYKPEGKRTVEEERLDGYLEALGKYEIVVDSSLISLGKYYSLEDDGLSSEGYRQMQQLLSREVRPTAVFATCDILAAGTLQAIYEASLRVPQDMSVIGFDNTLAPHLTPPLTTVGLPMLEIGKVAAQLAIAEKNQVEGLNSVSTRTLPTTLILRQSTGSSPKN